MNKRTKVILLLVLALVALATTVYVTRWRDTGTQGRTGPGAAGRSGRAGGDQPVSVRIASARSGSIDVVVEALGTVTARNTAVVRSRVDGLLQSIRFQEGREVKAGEVLAEIDPRPFEAALKQSEG
ncbi:MAG TPA: biotin/lipoyl-binding protein, partial [Steroidobacteraceae bacterium]|nr:biotin/lipoyl-binding protein [Steroidobacteraceae bacterium]